MIENNKEEGKYSNSYDIKITTENNEIVEKQKVQKNVVNKIKITDTTLRDALQSLLATRMTTEEMIPIVIRSLPRQPQVVFFTERFMDGGPRQQEEW